jgi:hypothetical protein
LIEQNAQLNGVEGKITVVQRAISKVEKKEAYLWVNGVTDLSTWNILMPLQTDVGDARLVNKKNNETQTVKSITPDQLLYPNFPCPLIVKVRPLIVCASILVAYE